MTNDFAKAAQALNAALEKLAASLNAQAIAITNAVQHVRDAQYTRLIATLRAIEEQKAR